ncbi:MAG: enoyl-CoA hydratase/isomerase family protein [Syntrophomonas sp.]
MQHLLFTQNEGIGVVTLNRPQALNATNMELFAELEECQTRIAQDRSIRAVVVSATGEHFTVGVDLNMLKQVDSQFILDRLSWLQRLYSRWQEMPVPVIAAVQGLCYGSGVELILGCDMRVASEDARFAIPEVRFGLSPDMGGTVRLTKLVGIGQAKRLIMGCEEIDAAEALRIGLIEVMVLRCQLMERAMRIAEKMAALPPAAIRFAKQGINLAAESSVMAGLLFEQAQSTFCCGTEDFSEAVNAFLEKRKPVFSGR